MSYRYPSPNPELYQALLRSYYRCLENKAAVKKTVFHLNHERIIHQLSLDIENKTYRPEMSNIFVVLHPKPREVIAAHLRDRIVHHFIHEYMAPHWEKRFVPNSYACRIGKGPMRANEDLEKFIRAYYRHNGAPLFYLQLDVQNFFPSIDLNILHQLVDKHLENPLYRWLCKTVIFHRSTLKGNFKLTCPRELWQKLPRYKSLFAAAPDKGLPIGNLTSQFFANVYMNQLDQFIAHRLKGGFLFCRGYVDDILFLSDDPQKLRGLVPQVQQFLSRELQMTLNVKKTVLQPLAKGLDHLGYWHKPDHRLVRQRVVRNCKVRVKGMTQEAEPNLNHLCSTMNSYLGYFRHARTLNLRRVIVKRLVTAPHLKGKLSTDLGMTRVVPFKDGGGQWVAIREKNYKEIFLREVEGGMDSRRVQAYLQNWVSLDGLVGHVSNIAL